jgi:hypothetical protein
MNVTVVDWRIKNKKTRAEDLGLTFLSSFSNGEKHAVLSVCPKEIPSGSVGAEGAITL